MAVLVSKGIVVPKLGILAADLNVGESVFLNVNGVLTEFIVIHQGVPNSTTYDVSCDGTWLMMKNVYIKSAFDSSNTDYANSDVHAYLNGTFLGLLNTEVQDAINQAKIPYKKGTGTSTSTVQTGSNGLSAKVFLLSSYELGWTTSNYTSMPVIGTCLNYFEGTSATDSKRIGRYSGTATRWWTRTPNKATANIMTVGENGNLGSFGYSNSYGVRPALIISKNTLFDEKTHEFKGVK
jgi:hypothetical protein